MGSDITALILGTAQDGGIPHIGAEEHPSWKDPTLRRTAAALAIIDHQSGERWLLEATPDIKEQLHHLYQTAGPPANRRRPVDGIAITHAHSGHYLGLAWLGREMLGADRVPVLVMPRMEQFLRKNLPWSDLIARENITLVSLQANRPHHLNDRITIEPLPLPHRDEHSETVAFRVAGPNASLLFLPDIDSWEELDERGGSIEEMIGSVDIALLDGTFLNGDELPGGKIGSVPHPTIEHSTERFASLPPEEREKIGFIHLNHTNRAAAPTWPIVREGTSWPL